MPIRNQIQAVVNQLNANPAFLYGSATELNTLADDVSLTNGLVMLYTLKPANIETTLSNAVDTTFNIYMEFLFQTPFEQYTAANETIVNQANAMMEEFVVKLSNYRPTPYVARFFYIKSDEKMKMMPVYNKLNINTTGVSLSISLNTMNNTGYDPNSRPVGWKAGIYG